MSLLQDLKDEVSKRKFQARDAVENQRMFLEEQSEKKTGFEGDLPEVFESEELDEKERQIGDLFL